MVKNEKIVSVSKYLGQTSKSTDKTSIGKVIDTTRGLTFKCKRDLEKKINEKKTNMIFNINNEVCHSIPKNIFDNANIKTGIM